MQKEELLNLLDPQARDLFERAKHLALEKGGVLSTLHLLVTALEGLSALPGRGEGSRERLLLAARSALTARYFSPAETIIVPKETQTVITEAGRLAKSENRLLASPAHLLRAALASPAVADLTREAMPVPRGNESAPETRHEIAEQPTAPLAKPLEGALAEFCADLAEEARSPSAHPFFGREREITAALETLCRKLKNNPLLIGRPGVGKTALVTAVASRLCQGKVPARLRGKRILEVSRLRLLADAKYTGEIEDRLKNLLADAREAGDVILFFDEIHTLLGAGGSGGTGDVANLLKSALSKGEITCVGATTLGEYYKYVARDEALARRFSTITIEEPSPAETQNILLHARSSFEAYHGVRIEDEVIAFIVEMADRYLHSRSFPDKAFDLLDRAAAKATLAGSDTLTREAVTETLSENTGLPLEIMDEDPAERLERLEAFLNAAVPGQQRAARDVARVVRIAKLQLELRPEQPDGVFLFVGPEGVGKQEMATALAKFLYGSPRKMIEFDMSQYAEQWAMSRLTGADPGYVGYGDRSGLLSKAAEDNPHSVLYFRNIDLAHPVVQQFLGEAFEQGRFTDSSGSRISLSNATVVMSLSRLSENTRHAPVGFFAHKEDDDERRGASGSLIKERGGQLVESLAATIDEVIEFQVLDREATEKIIVERLASLKGRLEAAQPVALHLAPGLAPFFADRLAAERKSLAHLERLWQEAVVLPFTQLHLARPAAGSKPEVAVTVEGDGVKVSLRGKQDAPAT